MNAGCLAEMLNKSWNAAPSVAMLPCGSRILLSGLPEAVPCCAAAGAVLLLLDGDSYPGDRSFLRQGEAR